MVKTEIFIYAVWGHLNVNVEMPECKKRIQKYKVVINPQVIGGKKPAPVRLIYSFSYMALLKNNLFCAYCCGKEIQGIVIMMN